MKKIFFWAFACILALYSCSNDEAPQIDEGNGEVVAVNIETSLLTQPTLRAGGSNPGSQNSGIDNVNSNDYKLRYILEIYNSAGTLVFEGRKAQDIAPGTNSTSFTVDLVKGATYNFVVWADMLDANGLTDAIVEAKGGDLHYKTDAGLAEIEMISTKFTVNDESKDAFTVSENKTISSSNVQESISLVLKRPLAKIRFLATDYEDLGNLKTKLTAVKSGLLSGQKIYSKYNAVTKVIDNDQLISNDAMVQAFEDAEPIVDADKNLTMFWDYMFVPAAEVSSGMNVKFGIQYMMEGKAVPTNGSQPYADKNIIIRPNMLTTVKAKVFSSTRIISITINDEFDTPEIEPTLGNVYIGNIAYSSITEALASIAAGETKTIELSGGLFNEDVNLPAGVSLKGMGDASVINGYISVDSNSELSDFKSYYLGQSNAGANTRSAVNVSGADVKINNVTFETETKNTFLNSTSVRNRSECIVASMQAKNLMVSNSRFSSNYWKSIYLNISDGVTLEKNIFDNTTAFSNDNFYNNFTVKDNQFVRTGSFNAAIPHIIVTGIAADGTLPADVIAFLTQMKGNNVWTESTTISNGDYSKAVRVQQIISPAYNKYVGKDGNTPANWSYRNP